MSIIEKRDLERHRRDIYLCKPVIQPGTTGFSPAEPGVMNPTPSRIFRDSLSESTIPGKSVTPISGPITMIDHQALPVSKSSQA
jgi:hypothetical protein